MNRHDLAERYGLDWRDLDEGPDDNARCLDCGCEFHVRWRPATRLQPAELIGPEECPACGSENWDEL